METLIQIFSQNKILWLILLALIILTFFVMTKAGKAVKKNNEEKEALIKRLDHLKMLRENYATLSEEKIKNDMSDMLLEGVASNIQLTIEKAEDMNEAFEELSDNKKMIYALNYFILDAKESVRSFFTDYSKPLTPYVVMATDKFADEKSKELVRKMYDIFDEENEEVSFFESEVAKIDEELKTKLDFENMIKTANEFIRENAKEFI